MGPKTIQEVPNETLDKQSRLTPIQEFYSNTNIFITGSTGFLGKILLEKLLRSCPGISTVYLLVRSKKGKDMHARVEEIFDDVIFDKMKNECPKFRHKIVGIAGDCSFPNLGISEQDANLLIKEVNVIFHVAATVRFDEKLKMAVAINVRGPQHMLRLARQMPNLKSAMHVSTAFSNCVNDVVEEKIYPSPIGYQELISMTEKLPEKMLEDITSRLLDNYPNTYAFTKQIAEDVVKQESDGLPVGILRPSIVVSTYKEPINGWINNMYGATGVAAGAGIGLLRALHCDPECNANIVPVDMCVNSLIAAAWEVATTFEESRRRQLDFSAPVYNFESSNEKPINWKDFMASSQKFGLLVPSSRAVWYYSFALYKYYVTYLFAIFFVHMLPALIVDGALICMLRPPKMTKVYAKIHRFTRVISYFSTRQWVFKSRKVQKLIEEMSEDDRKLFFCDLRELDWDEFFKNYLRGVRVYLIKDPLDTLPEARAKFKRLYWAHQTVKLVAGFLFLRILWFLLSPVYSMVF